MELRPLREQEYETAGQLTVDVYRSIVMAYDWGLAYLDKLADVATRARHAVVLGCFFEDIGLAGTVTLELATDIAGVARPPDDYGHARMLAVAEQARGRGAGRALMQKAIDISVEDGRPGLELMTMPEMTVAQAMYKSMGFRQVTDGPRYEFAQRECLIVYRFTV